MDINNALWLYSDKPLRTEMLDGLPVYCTKAVNRPYESFLLFDTYDLELNKQGITLAQKKTGGHKRLHLYDVFEDHSVTLPEKYIFPLTADRLRQSAFKRILYKTAGRRPLLAVQPVALSVRALSIVHTESGETVKVIEKRSSNSKSGYYFELTPIGAPMLDIVLPALIEAGFSQTLPAKYLRFFLKENPIAKKYAKPAVLRDTGGAPAINAVLESLTARTEAMLDLTFTHNDTESLHDLRVALRSLNSLLFTKPLIYKREDTAACKQALRNLRRLTSAIRDADVFLERMDIPENRGRFGELRKQITQKRAARLAELKTYCENNKLPEIPAACENSESEKLFAARINNILLTLKKLNKKNGGKPGKKLAHRIRITVKNLRYHLELLSHPCFEEDSHKTVGILKKIQSVLGHINDRVVQKKILKEFGINDHKNGGFAGIITEKPDKNEIKAVHKHIRDIISRLS